MSTSVSSNNLTDHRAPQPNVRSKNKKGPTTPPPVPLGRKSTTRLRARKRSTSDSPQAWNHDSLGRPRRPAPIGSPKNKAAEKQPSPAEQQPAAPALAPRARSNAQPSGSTSSLDETESETVTSWNTPLTADSPQSHFNRSCTNESGSDATTTERLDEPGSDATPTDWLSHRLQKMEIEPYYTSDQQAREAKFRASQKTSNSKVLGVVRAFPKPKNQNKPEDAQAMVDATNTKEPPQKLEKQKQKVDGTPLKAMPIRSSSSRHLQQLQSQVEKKSSHANLLDLNSKDLLATISEHGSEEMYNIRTLVSD